MAFDDTPWFIIYMTSSALRSSWLMGAWMDKRAQRTDVSAALKALATTGERSNGKHPARTPGSASIGAFSRNSNEEENRRRRASFNVSLFFTGTSASAETPESVSRDRPIRHDAFMLRRLCNPMRSRTCTMMQPECASILKTKKIDDVCASHS